MENSELEPILCRDPNGKREKNYASNRGHDDNNHEKISVVFLFPNQNIDNNFNDKIYYRECSSYIINPNRTKLCMCGYPISWHLEKGITEGQCGWSIETNTRLLPTNAMGRILFTNIPHQIPSKYVRIDALCRNFEPLLKLLTNVWKMRIPDIILSFNKEANCEELLCNRLGANLKFGLSSLAKCAKTWFFTSGNNYMLNKFLRHMKQDYCNPSSPLGFYHNSPLLLGITPWGCLNNRGNLVNSFQQDVDNEEFAAEWQWIEQEEDGLELLHDAFIMCDDGTTGNELSTSYYEFRTSLELAICSNYFKRTNPEDTDVYMLPLVKVMIEGNKQDLLECIIGLEKGIPLMVIKNSGKCADLLCDLIGQVNSIETELEMWILSVLQKFKEEWTIESEQEMHSLAIKLKTIVWKFYPKNLVQVFDFDKSNMNFSDAVIHAAISRQTKINENGEIEDCLFSGYAMVKLALLFDCTWLAEIAIKRKELDGILFTPISLEAQSKLYMIALKSGRAKIVELFFELGYAASVSDWLTIEVLIELYEHVLDSSNGINNDGSYLLKDMVDKQKEKIGTVPYLRETANEKYVMMYLLGSIIKSYTNCIFQNSFDFKKYPLQKPALPVPSGLSTHSIFYHEFPPHRRIFNSQDFFIWAVLSHQVDLVKLIWKIGQDRIACVLIASIIWKRMQRFAENHGENEFGKQLGEDAENFETMAIDILEKAHDLNKAYSNHLLTRVLPQFSGSTLLEIAYNNDSKKIICSTACQTLMQKIWMGKMNPLVSIWKIWLNLPFSFMFIRMIYFVSDPLADNIQKVVKQEISAGNKSGDHDNDLNGTRLHRNLSAKQLTFESIMRPFSRNPSLKAEYFQSIRYFYSAPISRFLIYIVFHVILVVFFTFVVLMELRPLSAGNQPSWLEIVCWMWFIVLIMEEISQILLSGKRTVKEKLHAYSESIWNKISIIRNFIFIIAVVLRLTTDESPTNNGFKVARIMYGFTMALLYIRTMEFYLAQKVIGPKVIMIGKMMNDLLFFLSIFVIFMLAYGTIIQAILYPNQPPGLDVVRSVMYQPYWHLYGELFLDEITDAVVSQPEVNIIAVLIFMVYMIMTNVLLLNLLIAMFGYTFNKIQESSEMVWNYNRYALINSTYNKPLLPPPFSIVEIVIDLVKYYNHSSETISRETSEFRQHFGTIENNLITAFENECAENYADQKSKEEIESTKNVNIYEAKFEEIRQNQLNFNDNTNKKIQSLEESLKNMLEILKKIEDKIK